MKYNRFFSGVATITLIAGLAACENKLTNAVDTVRGVVGGGELPEWTVAVYMAADNNLSIQGIANIDSMEAAGFDSRVRVVIQAEFSPSEMAAIGCDAACFNRPNFNTFRYAITGQGPSVPGPNGPALDIGNRNMVDPAQLADFIQWTRNNYPAKRSLIVLWNHGGGYVGLLTDDTSAPNELMSLTGLQTALGATPINVLGFDMCLMAGYETMVKIAGPAQNVVFSEETVPGDGFPYRPILSGLYANPFATDRAVAALIADQYAAHYAETDEATTISAFNMAGFNPFETSLNTLATSLRAGLPALGPSIATAAASSQKFYYRELTDIVNFLDSLNVRVQDVSLQSQIAVVRSQLVDPDFRIRSHFTNGSDGDLSRSNGLNIVLPSGIDGDTFMSSGARTLAAYQALFPDQPWTAFLTDFVAGQPTEPTPPADTRTARCFRFF